MKIVLRDRLDWTDPSDHSTHVVTLLMTYEDGSLNLDDITSTSLVSANRIPDDVIDARRNDIERMLNSIDFDQGNEDEWLDQMNEDPSMVEYIMFSK